MLLEDVAVPLNLVSPVLAKHPVGRTPQNQKTIPVKLRNPHLQSRMPSPVIFSIFHSLTFFLDSSPEMFLIKESAWDQVFEDVKDISSLSQASRLNRSTTNQRVRRQTMTMREISVFDEMFDLLFSAVSEHKAPRDEKSFPRTLSPSGTGIGKSHGGGSTQMDDFFGRLRTHSRKLKWTSEADQELDRKKEEMDLCDTDQQLLEWAMREVFGESKRYEEAAREAIKDHSSATSSTLSPKEITHLQPPSYPHLLAILMKTFRDKYHDPHLALSIFDQARHLSIPSFVFGCTTPTYNELIQTRWECFRDLRGVCDALEEMRINGVEMDYRTRSLAETIRREVGERNLWEEETSGKSGEVWQMVTFIERITAKQSRSTQTNENNRSNNPITDRLNNLDSGKAKVRKNRRWGPEQEEWRTRALKSEDGDDGWEFGKWEEPKRLQTA